jgi:hypothetical protein
MKNFYFLIFLFMSMPFAHSTTYANIPLSELVQRSEHIIIATVKEVEVIDRNGNVLRDPNGRTRGNTVRFYLVLRENGVIKTSLDVFPKEIVVDEQTKLITTVSMVRSAVGEKIICLLVGKNFSPVSNIGWARNLSEEDMIIKFATKKPNKQRNSDSGAIAPPLVR